MKTRLLVVLLAVDVDAYGDGLATFDFASAFDVTVTFDRVEREGYAVCRALNVETDGPASLLTAAIHETARREGWSCTLAPNPLPPGVPFPRQRADDGGRSVRRAG